MSSEKIFTCRQCDADMEIEDPYNTDTAVCHNCGQTYTLQWVEEESAYEMIEVEPVEQEARNTASEEEDEPFRILNEPGAPRRDDLDRY
jgi:NMD protein affecting ribosome stability and mRNA decay